MLKKILFLTLVLLFSVSLASAKTFTIKLHHPAVVEGTELQPGNYKVELSESKATITNGRVTVETQVKQEESEEKFRTTSVRFTDADGKMKIREIRVGGSNTKVILN